MISDARIDAANALIRATMILMARRHATVRLSVIGAGTEPEILMADGADRWVEADAQHGRDGDVPAALVLAATIGADHSVVLTDPPGFALLASLVTSPAGHTATFLTVRRGADPVTAEDVVAALIRGDLDGGAR